MYVSHRDMAWRFSHKFNLIHSILDFKFVHKELNISRERLYLHIFIKFVAVFKTTYDLYGTESCG